jgi:flagellar basal-body rod protein FlgB
MKVSSIDPAVRALQQTLHRSSRRTEAVASNLANVDTPGYRALDVEFPDPQLFRSEMRRTDASHLPVLADPVFRGTFVEAPVSRVRSDGNTVDVDREMTLFAMLQGRYRASAQMLRKRFGLWMYAVTDGRE